MDNVVLEQESKSISDDVSMSPKRLENESFLDYKNRQKVNTLLTKMVLRGNVIWNSREKGTYGKTI